MIRVRALLLTCVMAATLVLAAPAATAATLQDHGWWWRGQSGLLMELPPPPSVPVDGLSVALAPDGDVAWSAVRFQLEDNETAPVLVLTVANDLGGAVAVIDACRPNVRWRGGQAQRWDTRPQPQCDDGAVTGVRSEDGTSWSWDLSALAGDDGLVDVVLVPGQDAQAFQQDFEPPTESSLQTTITPTAPDPVDPPVLPPAQDESAAPAPPPPVAGPGPPPVAPLSPAPAAPADPAPAPHEPEVAPPAATGGSAAREQTPVVASEPAVVASQDLGRPIGILLLIGVMLTVLQLRGAGTPAIHGIGRFASATATQVEVRGLGRFSRPRSGRPDPLI